MFFVLPSNYIAITETRYKHRKAQKGTQGHVPTLISC